jgi:hypothetical protein
MWGTLSDEMMGVSFTCCLPSPAQSFSGPSPAGLTIICYCFRFQTSPTWRARSPYLYHPEQGGLVIPPGTAIHFRRLLRLAGIRWSYSNPPPHRSSVTIRRSAKCVRCIACRDVRCRNRKKPIDLNIRGTRALLDGRHDVR